MKGVGCRYRHSRMSADISVCLRTIATVCGLRQLSAVTRLRKPPDQLPLLLLRPWGIRGRGNWRGGTGALGSLQVGLPLHPAGWTHGQVCFLTDLVAMHQANLHIPIDGRLHGRILDLLGKRREHLIPDLRGIGCLHAPPVVQRGEEPGPYHCRHGILARNPYDASVGAHRAGDRSFSCHGRCLRPFG